MGIRSPYSILESQVGVFAGLLPRVRLADVEPVHEARVTTRRLRELLPIVDDGRASKAVFRRIRKAGRAIGKVRELDVLDSLIVGLSPRATFAAETLSRLRHDVHEERTRRRRRMVRALEQLELHDLAATLTGVGLIRPRLRSLDRDWMQRLKTRMAKRVDAARAAIDGASNVYFADRSHAVRIALKKLRYAVEIAAETGVWRPPHLLKDLRRVQEALGEIHDTQILLERVETLSADPPVPHEAGWLLDLLRAEIEDGHRQFLAKVERVRGAVDACDQWANGHPSRRRRFWFSAPLIAASALAVPILAASRDDHASKHLLTALQFRR